MLLQQPQGDDLNADGPQLSQGVLQQLAQLAGPPISAAGKTSLLAGSGIWDGADAVRVDDWLGWLMGAYLDSKRNASALFEALYDR